MKMRLPIAIIAAWWASACGATVFVDPDAERKEELTFGLLENLVVDGDPRTYLHLRINTRGPIDDVRFYLRSPSGRLALGDEGRHVQPCAEGRTCLSYVLGLGIPRDIDAVILEVPEIGHSATGVLRQVQLQAHGASAQALLGNEVMSVQSFDPIRAYYARAEDTGDGLVTLFPRAFESHAAPGPCGSPPASDDPGWRPVGPTRPFETPATFSPEPEALACLTMRPKLPIGGPEVAQVTLPARALIERRTHVYSPPRERAPLIYQILFDLEMPSEARCTAAEALVSDAVREAATNIAANEALASEVLELPVVEIANDQGVRCRQAPDRRFDANAVGRADAAEILSRFGQDRQVTVVLVYATNLDITMPQNLQQSISNLAAYFRLSPYLIFISPDRPAASFSNNEKLPWTTTQEPSFRESITTLFSQVWPFTAALHSDLTFVPLVRPEEAEGILQFRICMANPEVTPVGTPVAEAFSLVPAAIGPGYNVHFQGGQILLPLRQYTAPSALVTWEACRGLCDRPAPASVATTPWSQVASCL